MKVEEATPAYFAPVNGMRPIHPGEVLREEFLLPLGITQYRLAKEIGVTEARISAICSGKRSITADTALRLARYFGGDAQSWLNLQQSYDLKVAEKSALQTILKTVMPFEGVALSH
jgi:addiction module HigA family antidote